MHIGIATVSLRIPENDNLKGKRRIVHSIMAKVRAKFNVAIAEVGDNDLWQTALLGVTCVSNDGRHANSVLTDVVNYIIEIAGDAEVGDCHIEIIAG